MKYCIYLLESCEFKRFKTKKIKQLTTSNVSRTFYVKINFCLGFYDTGKYETKKFHICGVSKFFLFYIISKPANILTKTLH